MAISGRHSQPVQAAVKMEKAEIWGVAALTAQPLAALPPYGCGVPFTGSERLVHLQIMQRKFIGMRLPSLSLRGPEGAVAISQYLAGSQEGRGENATACPRLHPKGTSSRFALRATRRPLASSQ